MRRSVERCVLQSMLLLIAPAAFAQGDGSAQESPRSEPEVLIGRTARNGGWGAPVVQVSTIRDRAAVFLGGRGGWLLDGRLTLGGGAFGLVSSIPAPPAAGKPGENLDLRMGYGGAWIEYTFAPLRLLHVSVGTLLGGGSLSLAWHDGGSYGSGTRGFFVGEPAVLAELNLAEHVRLNLGAAYRWIPGAHLQGLSYSDLSGFSLVAAVKFGKF